VGELELDITKMLKQEIEPLKEKAQKLIAGVDEAITNLNEIFDNASMQELPQTFTSLKNTMANLENLSGKLDGIVGNNSTRINEIFNHVHSISENLHNNNETLERAIKNIGAFTDTLASVQLASTIRKVDKAMNDFAEITGKINAGEGTMGQLVNNDSLHTELVNASHSLDMLLNDMQAHPSRYVRFSVFGGKEQTQFSKKELEQMRGEIDRAIEEKDAADPAKEN
jgi:phospholipid/cholesterol/gamma-HCH transport system substrate-binding protein